MDKQFAEAIGDFVDPLETDPRSPMSVTSNDASVNQSRVSQGAVTFQVLEPVPEEQQPDETDVQYLKRVLEATQSSRDETREVNRKMQARIMQLREETNKAHMELANASVADITKLRDQMQKLRQRSAQKDSDFERLSKQVEATTNAYANATDDQGNPIDVKRMLKDYKRVKEHLDKTSTVALIAQNELRETNGEIDRLIEQRTQRTQEADDALLQLEEEQERSTTLKDTLQREREQHLTQADELKTRADELRTQLEEAQQKLASYEDPTNRSGNAIVTRGGKACPHCPKLFEDLKAAKRETKSLRAINDSSLKEADRLRGERAAAKEAAMSAQRLLAEAQGTAAKIEEAHKVQVIVLEDDLKKSQEIATENLLAYTKVSAELQNLKAKENKAAAPSLRDIEFPREDTPTRSRGASISPNSHQSNIRSVNAAHRELAGSLENALRDLKEEQAKHDDTKELAHCQDKFVQYCLGCAPESWQMVIKAMIESEDRTHFLPMIRHMREALAQEVDWLARLSLTNFGTRNKRVRTAPKYITNLCNALMVATCAVCATAWEKERKDESSTATIVSQVGLEVEMLQSFHTTSMAMATLAAMFSHPGWMSLSPTRIHPDYRRYCIDRAYRVQQKDYPTDDDAPTKYPHPVFGFKDWREAPRAEFHPVNDVNSPLYKEDGLTAEYDLSSYANKELYTQNEEYALELVPEDGAALPKVLPSEEGRPGA
jgi:myosin heavy subunit